MGQQNFFDLTNIPPIANLTAVTATTETALWDAATYTAIAAGEGYAGKQWRLTAGGIMSFASTGTLTITPRFGTSIAGTTMGPSVVALTTPGATTAHSWWLDMLITVRTRGAPGTNSTVICNGMFCTGIPSAGSLPATQTFGGTSASVDLSIASGICIGWTLSVAGTVTPQQICFGSPN